MKQVMTWLEIIPACTLINCDPSSSNSIFQFLLGMSLSGQILQTLHLNE
jgi:hypothetical protein